MSVKRNEFIRHLENHNCIFRRYGSKHDIYQNLNTKKKTTLSRHSQIDKHLADTICKQLVIPKF